MKTPIYHPEKTYLENLEKGPFYQGEIPKRVDNSPIDFLGFKLRSPIGVPAGPLLNANWIRLAADLGYDVLTYKTIRNYAHPSHPLPNIAFVDTDGQLDPSVLPNHLEITYEPPADIDQIAITNSFGNPCLSPEYLRQDLPKAMNRLHPGQLLIVSVFGTTLEEYLETARFAVGCGAQVIEANYSCPNVSKKEGSLFANPEAVYHFSKALVNVIGEIPLVIKMGAIPDQNQMQKVLEAAARAGVRAVCGINTISMKVTPPLRGNRSQCGICGAPIRQAAIDFTKQTKAIIEREKLDLELLATGGVTQPHHFQELLDAGATIAMTATGMMWDPLLATHYHQGIKAHVS